MQCIEAVSHCTVLNVLCCIVFLAFWAAWLLVKIELGVVERVRLRASNLQHCVWLHVGPLGSQGMFYSQRVSRHVYLVKLIKLW